MELIIKMGVLNNSIYRIKLKEEYEKK